MIYRLPENAFKIIEILRAYNKLTLNELVEYLQEIGVNSMKYSIRRLLENNIIEQIPNLLDMRKCSYQLVSVDEIKQNKSNFKPSLYDKIMDIIDQPMLENNYFEGRLENYSELSRA